MYFSFRGERKVPKESPRKESTQVLSLRILSPVRRSFFALRQKRLMRCYFTDHRMSATSAERRARGFCLLAGTCNETSRSAPYPRASSARTALRRSCGVLGVLDFYAQSDSDAPLWARSRAPDGGFLKGGIGASLKWRSFGTFLSTGREKYTKQSSLQTQVYHPNQSSSTSRILNRTLYLVFSVSVMMPY